LASGFSAVAPAQLIIDKFEERLNHRIVVAAAIAAH
jgi:hypothetical protein